MPAEWERHEAVWLSWPHADGESYPGKTLDWVMPEYAGFVRELTRWVRVYINVRGDNDRRAAEVALDGVLDRVTFFDIPTNEPWVRDHGCIFVVDDRGGRRAVSLRFNAWGEKYEPYADDAAAGARMAEALGVPVYRSRLTGEGGGLEVNGGGVLLSTGSCFLAESRNSTYSQSEVEHELRMAFGVDRVHWAEAAILGDDTDGHIDTTTRFVPGNRVLVSVAEKEANADYSVLREHAEQLARSGFEVVRLPVPEPFSVEPPEECGESWCVPQAPAGYANFLVTNGAVLVPTYGDPADERALEIIASCFPDREAVGLESGRLIWGLGSFHCLTQQVPVGGTGKGAPLRRPL